MDGPAPDAEVPLFTRVVRQTVRRQDVIHPMLVRDFSELDARVGGYVMEPQGGHSD